MTTFDIIMRILHFVAIMAIYGCLLSSHLFTAREMPRKLVKKVAVIDAMYGMTAILVLVSGLYLWFGGPKGADWYTKNGLFHGKLTLFVLAAILSAYPTMFWIKNRKGDPSDVVHVPKLVTILQGVQLLFLLLIPILAVLMAQGIGRSSS